MQVTNIPELFIWEFPPPPPPKMSGALGDLLVLMDGSALLSYAKWKLAQVMFGSLCLKSQNLVF